MRWFRYYDDALDDPKVQQLPGDLFKIWVNVLCIASKRGGKLPEIKDIAFKLRMSMEQTKQAIDMLQSFDLIDKKKRHLSPHNWAKRQYVSDNAAERMRRHRARKRDVTVTSPVTSPLRPRTDTDTDTESDTEKKKAVEKQMSDVGSALRARGAARVDFSDPVNRYAFACKKIATGLSERMGAVEAQTVILAADSGDAKALEICRAEARKQRVTYKKPVIPMRREA